jgi:hypothetical protein
MTDKEAMEYLEQIVGLYKKGIPLTYTDGENDAIETVLEALKKKDRQLKIKDKYLELIYFLGVDYDGWNTVESLKSLIDDLIDYVKKAGNNDDKAPIYSGFNGENFNILYERLDNKGDIENE